MAKTMHSPRLVGLVADFLHREVGEPEDESLIDAITLLDIIKEDEVGYGAEFERLVEEEDYFVLIFDEDIDVLPGMDDTETSQWEIVVMRQGKAVELVSDTFDGLMSKVRESRA